MAPRKISLPLGILININVIIGGAFFISSGIIMQKAGPLAPLYWVLVGLILLPLASSLATLAGTYPVAGGIYVYSERLLGSFWGFLSGWGYYVGTAAGNAVLLFEFRRRLGPFGFQFAGDFTLDILLVLLFSVISVFDIEFLGPLQLAFTCLKFIPFFVVVTGALFLFSPTHLSGPFVPEAGQLIESIPLVLFAYIGIETCCALGHLLENGTQNASRVIYLSFAIIIAFYTLMQLCLVGIHGTTSVEPFLDILGKVTSNAVIVQWGNVLISFAILSSFLGGFYSMFYANNWTLHQMAREDRIHGATFLSTINTWGAPAGAIAFQTLLIILLLAFSHNIENLTTMSDFGIVIAYLLSSVAFIVQKSRRTLIGLLSLGSCSYLLYVCWLDLLRAGTQFLLPFLVLLCLGVLSFMMKRKV